jgi:hypothetical protein
MLMPCYRLQFERWAHRGEAIVTEEADSESSFGSSSRKPFIQAIVIS